MPFSNVMRGAGTGLFSARDELSPTHIFISLDTHQSVKISINWQLYGVKSLLTSAANILS